MGLSHYWAIEAYYLTTIKRQYCSPPTKNETAGSGLGSHPEGVKSES